LPTASFAPQPQRRLFLEEARHLGQEFRERQGDDEKSDDQEHYENDRNPQSPSQTVRFEPLDRRAQRADDDERPDEDENGR
jgi:hypothetical protein